MAKYSFIEIVEKIKLNDFTPHQKAKIIYWCIAVSVAIILYNGVKLYLTVA